MQYLQDKNLPKLNDDQCDLCEKGETDEEVKNELNKMEINKSPGNDGLKKEFYEVFWDHVKVPLLLSFSPSVTLKFLSFSFCHVKVPLLPLLLSVAFLKRELSTSRKQALIKLIEKKDRDKRFIKNWRPISLLNVDVKLTSKVLSNQIKNLLPKLTSTNENAYVTNRFISEEGRLISDILEMKNNLNMKGYLLTIDIEKAFAPLTTIFYLLF